MGSHRAARPGKRNALIVAAVIAVAGSQLGDRFMPALDSGGDEAAQVPWATDSSPVAAQAPVDPDQAALELAQAGQDRASDSDAPAGRSLRSETPAERLEGLDTKVTPPPPATISGVVRTPSGARLDNVVVEAVAVQSPRTPLGDELTRAPVAATVLSGDTAAGRGAYALEVPAGRYVVRYRPAPGGQAWRADYNGDVAAGEPFMVDPGEGIAMASQQMERSRPVTIRGLVWDESAAMVPNVVVQLVRKAGATMVPVDFAMTDELGAFEFPLAARGERYTVRIRGGSDTEGTVLPVGHAWFGDVTESVQARWVTAGEGASKVTLGPIRITERIETVTAPTIEGDVRVGAVLEVADGTWNTTPAAEASASEPSRNQGLDPGLTYQWLLDGEEIANAVAPTYRVAQADLGSIISVRTRATVAGVSAEAYALPQLVRQAAPPTATTPPTLDGDPVVGERLTADVGEWAPRAGASSGQVRTSVAWQRDGIRIPGATGRTYRVQSGDVGHEIAAVVAAVVTSQAGRSETALVPTVPVRIDNLLSTTTAERVGNRVAVTVTSSGGDPVTGEVMLLDGRGGVLTRRPLTAADGGSLTMPGAGSSVVFLGGPGLTDSTAALGRARAGR
ncbi:hypothetical protein KLP28_09425 [Nocardioidaceae bacterium]|nr:hypothetical protein KLP28_09425 [Nocardioidaceae bacterium]